MLYIYGLWLHCHCWFPMHSTLDHSVFQGVQYIACTLYNAHFSYEQAYQQHVDEQENILEMVQCSPTISMQRLYMSLSFMNMCMVNDTWRQLVPTAPTVGAKPHPGDSATHPEFSHWLQTNYQLLALKLFTDEATFTYNGINNTCNSHW
jgi:hypothetical protein